VYLLEIKFPHLSTLHAYYSKKNNNLRKINLQNQIELLQEDIDEEAVEEEGIVGIRI
jgi:hypothetical protein